MKFSKLEEIMSSENIYTLADIARALNTTPQAVSNWKARNQVPYHIVDKINKQKTHNEGMRSSNSQRLNVLDQNKISLSDFLLTIAQQSKIIILVIIISVFLTFTYVQFIQIPLYKSSSTVLLPENKSSMGGGLAGIASQFGVNMPQNVETNLSSPSLFPELIKSRLFTEIVLRKNFYYSKFNKKLPLLAILNNIEKVDLENKLALQSAVGEFSKMVKFETQGALSKLSVSAKEPLLAQELNKTIMDELVLLNKFYKNQSVSEKINFIDNRIMLVETELKESEQSLKLFRQQNLQILSAALKLNEERLTRNVEIQKGIFLTLKQELELAKIEEIQKSSIVQFLDQPQLPLGPFNKNIKLSLILSFIFGAGLGFVVAFLRAYFNNSDISERKKLRRVKNFVNKKSKDFIVDYRVSGIMSVVLMIGLPFYIGHRSADPVLFGMYSIKLFIINIIYVVILLFFVVSFFYAKKIK
jgi:uncharacterized protein involved in exopolysaccharide biosynthesis